MTRNEFIREVTTFGELLDFCREKECYACDDIYDEDGKDSEIEDNLIYLVQEADSWQELLQTLYNIPCGDNWYTYDDGKFYAADEYDFRFHKQNVLEWGDYNDIWDRPLEDEVSSNIEQNETTDLKLEEGCSMSELFGSSLSLLQDIKSEENQKEEEEKQLFENLISVQNIGGSE